MDFRKQHSWEKEDKMCNVATASKENCRLWHELNLQKPWSTTWQSNMEENEINKWNISLLFKVNLGREWIVGVMPCSFLIWKCFLTCIPSTLQVVILIWPSVNERPFAKFRSGFEWQIALIFWGERIIYTFQFETINHQDYSFFLLLCYCSLAFPGAKDQQCGVWLKKSRRTLFAIQSCSLLPHFSGICCFFQSDFERIIPVSVAFIQFMGMFPFSVHTKQPFYWSACASFSLLQFPIFCTTIRVRETFSVTTHCY